MSPGLAKEVNLLNVSWLRVRGNGFPKSSTAPAVGAPLSDSHKPTLSKPHCVKGFADDLTIISQCECEHASALLSGSEKCSDIDLQIHPDKCVSVVYSGSKFKKSCSFPIGGGH